ncbi:MAG: hypothetical protein ACRDRB_01485, partial [Pseudonocardiaceae bacterium]
MTPVPGVTLARIGGHFDGAAVLHWPAGSDGRGALVEGGQRGRCRPVTGPLWCHRAVAPVRESRLAMLRHRAP